MVSTPLAKRALHSTIPKEEAYFWGATAARRVASMKRRCILGGWVILIGIWGIRYLRGFIKRLYRYNGPNPHP